MPKDAPAATKTNPGRFFEDYRVGQVIEHAVPRTVSGGERALYHALYPSRHAVYSSDEFAKLCGLHESPMDDMITFHTVFGKSVPDVSLNAVANLGYAEGRFHQPVWRGDTLLARSEVIGLKQNSSGKTGVVYVRTEGRNQHGSVVLDYVRWVMVRKERHGCARARSGGAGAVARGRSGQPDPARGAGFLALRLHAGR